MTVSLEGLAATSEGRQPHTTSAAGEAQFAEDADKQFVAPTGTKVTVLLQKGRRVRRVPMTLGHDAGGCHIALLKGARTVRF